ncbi:WD40 repeat-like protein [Coniophora puteana RWD-64-598 SS2]|uniref:DNA damage-binding protein CMR1 n=1 Tax=Coniophora puteana (strain RWD-64-598) TaxID=741705 RepID=A0A5M3N183_CONPW|nr:WD40 repeat-like protein [Coniophora puteana RWD-64-598 SS2]EIW85143.1 WD40 repeat-like protein [Coniophora puteana RWD-64-598 SS2]
MSAYEKEREANIARNRAILEQLDLKDAASQLGVPAKSKSQTKPKAKPVQPKKRPRQESEPVAPRRQSARLMKEVIDLNESPVTKQKREAERERIAKQAEQERLEAEERERIAKRPRHQDLDLFTTLGEQNGTDIATLRTALGSATKDVHAKRVSDLDAFVFDTDKGNAAEVKDLRDRLHKLKIVSRAKVTGNRVYSAAYHPDKTKDLVFFGDKHGQLGIWDARAPTEEGADEDGDVTANDATEGGKYWQLQNHWPASPKSSISSIKFDPTDAHSVITASYDCTIRRLSFISGISEELFSSEDTLVSNIDLAPNQHEMWISTANGTIINLDLRQDKSKARWYDLQDQKIGSISVNPTNPHYLLTASNNRTLKVWDIRMLRTLQSGKSLNTSSEPYRFDYDTMQNFIESKRGQGFLRGEFGHGKSVSSAFWDPRGRSIVSTSYDDTIRLWELDSAKLGSSTSFPSFTPFCRIRHNCQTGKWLTILRAVWSPNPDVYPHFTIAGIRDHAVYVYSCKGDLLAKLADSTKVTATQAVTCSHPEVVERVATGNASGRCVLWAPPDP